MKLQFAKDEQPGNAAYVLIGELPGRQVGLVGLAATLAASES
jgi:hypothetical protein